MQKLFITLSAIPLSLYRSSVAGLKLDNPNLYSDIFSKYGSGTNKNNKNRIYFPLGEKAVVDTKNPNAKIVEFLTKNNFKIDNYRLGTAIMPDGKRTIKIGKLLSKEPELKKLFDNDPSRIGSNLDDSSMLVVVSRHPYDILGVSFDRGWTSCTNLGDGINAKKLKASLKYGLLVAYLIKASDSNINKPIARILIRPYFNSNGDVILSADKKEYGTANSAFRQATITFLNWANSGSPKGKYNAPEKMYLDTAPSKIWHDLKADDVTKAAQIQYITDENELMVLAKSKSVFRQAAMENKYATPKVLMVGVQDTDPRVRSAVMQNANASEYVMMVGVQDTDPRVRSSVIKNSNVTTKIIMLLAKDVDLDVLYAVAQHDKASTETLMLLAKNKDSRVRYLVTANKNSNAEILMLLAKDENNDVRHGVANNSKTNQEVLMKLTKDEDDGIREGVAEHPNASQKILLMLAKDPNYQVRSLVMLNVRATPEILMIGAKDEHWQVRKSVMLNVRATPEILMIGAKDEHWQVRRSVMSNENATTEMERIINEFVDEDDAAIAKKRKLYKARRLR